MRVLVWIVLIAALAIALVAEFGIDVGPADASFLHWLKHGVIFWAGLTTGAALTVLYYRSRRAPG